MSGAVSWRTSGWVLPGLIAVLMVAPGCSGSTPTPEPVDAGEDVQDPLPETITVSGNAEVYPDAVTYLTDRSLPVPELSGLVLRAEEPQLVAVGELERGLFGEVQLDSSGTFSVATVRPAELTLGLAARILDEGADGGVPRVTGAATMLYDVLLEGGKPELDLTGAMAFALPVSFTDALEAAVGPAQIQTISGGMDLAEAGFILGKIVDETGAPLAGASLEFLDNAQYAANLFYPSADFTTANQTATSENGLFVYVKGRDGTTDTFGFQIRDRPEYLARKGGAAKDSALIITVYPGTEAP